ncbi:MAG: NAD(+) synthase, partial [Ktedonobacteraceae bacterium]
VAAFRARLHDPRRRQERTQVPAENVPLYVISHTPVHTPIMAQSEQPVVIGAPQRIEPRLERLEEIYAAWVLGTGDYARKTGFKKALIALSGGIDSALVAAIAVDALGAENVLGVSMPSGYSSEGSKTDAWELAENLGMRCLTLPIEAIFRTSLQALIPALGEEDPGLAGENLQARIRGNLIMSMSNKQGSLVLTTGNKSEMAVGYCTLYGDMAGGFAVLKDVFKTLVYELCVYRNTLGSQAVIPQAIIDKPPSAELRPDQKDTDSLPPYEILDPILRAYVEQDRSIEEISAMGFDTMIVQRVARLVDINEYKRRQAPPCVKITPRAFGRDRRLPITNRYRETV